MHFTRLDAFHDLDEIEILNFHNEVFEFFDQAWRQDFDCDDLAFFFGPTGFYDALVREDWGVFKLPPLFERVEILRPAASRFEARADWAGVFFNGKLSLDAKFRQIGANWDFPNLTIDRF